MNDMSKRNRIRLLILSIVFGVLISGCGVLYQEKEIDSYVVDSNDLLAKGYSFEKVEVRRLFEKEEIFHVNNEKELALLVIKNVEQGQFKTHYLSETDFSLQRVYLFVETLLPDSYYLQAGVIQYNDVFDSSMKTRFIEVVLDEERFNQSQQYAENLINELNLVNLSTKDQIRKIHDYLVQNTKYDEALLELDISEYQNHPSFTPYGIYFHNTAVCSGYARSFMQLTRLLDIPSIMVSSQNMNHAWNMVYDGRNWLYIDATWNDPVPDQENRVLYTYYMLTHNQFTSKGHHFFDLASEQTLSIDEVMEFVNYAFAINE